MARKPRLPDRLAEKMRADWLLYLGGGDPPEIRRRKDEVSGALQKRRLKAENAVSGRTFKVRRKIRV